MKSFQNEEGQFCNQFMNKNSEQINKPKERRLYDLQLVEIINHIAVDNVKRRKHLGHETGLFDSVFIGPYTDRTRQKYGRFWNVSRKPLKLDLKVSFLLFVPHFTPIDHFRACLSVFRSPLYAPPLM